MYMNFVPLEKALPLVEAVNNARTVREHELCKERLRGYMQRCEELGQMWPCIALDLALSDNGMPTCCGEYLDWEPTEE